MPKGAKPLRDKGDGINNVFGPSPPISQLILLSYYTQFYPPPFFLITDSVKSPSQRAPFLKTCGIQRIMIRK